MSYILDALKKSEQERGHGSVPGVQTIHSSSVNYHQDKRTIWPWFLFAAVIINIVALVYFMQTRNSVEIVSTNEPQETTAAITHISVNTQKLSEARSLDASESVPAATITAPTNDNVQDIKQIYIVEKPAAKEIVNIHDLPLNIRQHIPEMVFSAHVYSTNPRQRSLVINGRFMEEGEAVNNDLILLEITAEGAIFDYQGRQFSTSVLSGWN